MQEYVNQHMRYKFRFCRSIGLSIGWQLQESRNMFIQKIWICSDGHLVNCCWVFAFGGKHAQIMRKRENLNKTWSISPLRMHVTNRVHFLEGRAGPKLWYWLLGLRHLCLPKCAHILSPCIGKGLAYEVGKTIMEVLTCKKKVQWFPFSKKKLRTAAKDFVLTHHVLIYNLAGPETIFFWMKQ